MSFPWDAVAALGTAATAIGVPATLYLGWRSSTKAMRQERYLQYVARYQEIIINLPYNIFWKNNQVSVNDDKRVWLMRYIDLCDEELFDHGKGLIEGDVWKYWNEFIIDNFKRSVPLQGLFKEVRGDYTKLDNFLKGGGLFQEEGSAKSNKIPLPR